MSAFTVPASVRSTVTGLDAAHGIWIDGSGRRSVADREFAVVDPTTGDEITTIANGSRDDALDAVESAHGALAPWSALAPRRRSELLHATFDALIAQREELAHLVSWENGKPLADSRAEITYSAEFFRWFAEEAVRTEGQYGEAPSGGVRTIVTHRPIGVAALITPWNFPAAMAARKIAPALAAGCTVVLKPASETPLTALAIARLMTSLGVPPGVVNVVPSTSASEVVGAWLGHSEVRKLSFTGSTEVGRRLLAQAAERVVSTSMELGGNAPFVVADDADLDAAIDGALIAKFRNGGQACTAANRFYVHDSVADEFSERMLVALGTLVLGSPFDQRTTIGPMINARTARSIERLIDDAVSAGARVAGRQVTAPGEAFVAPTILTDVSPDNPILAQEVFGPVVPIVRWRDDDDLVAQLNSTEYGLAAYVFSRDLQRAITIAEATEAGMFGINRGLVSDPSAPFGGVNQSGIGREGAREGIREFQEAQYFSVAWN